MLTCETVLAPMTVVVGDEVVADAFGVTSWKILSLITNMEKAEENAEISVKYSYKCAERIFNLRLILRSQLK